MEILEEISMWIFNKRKGFIPKFIRYRVLWVSDSVSKDDALCIWWTRDGLFFGRWMDTKNNGREFCCPAYLWRGGGEMHVFWEFILWDNEDVLWFLSIYMYVYILVYFSILYRTILWQILLIISLEVVDWPKSLCSLLLCYAKYNEMRFCLLFHYIDLTIRRFRWFCSKNIMNTVWYPI